MEAECDVCGIVYADTDLTTATTTYAKAGEELKTTSKRYCDFCLHQEPDYVKVYGDGETAPPDPEEGTEVDITGPDLGTVEAEEETP